MPNPTWLQQCSNLAAELERAQYTIIGMRFYTNSGYLYNCPFTMLDLLALDKATADSICGAATGDVFNLKAFAIGEKDNKLIVIHI
jgi:hypothetical protein